MKNKETSEVLGEYVSTLIMWLNDDSRRGQKSKRDKIARLGEELVKRGVLKQDDADRFYKGEC